MNDHPYPTDSISRFLESFDHPTPFLIIDLEVVRQRFMSLRTALPNVEIYYAVKALPEPHQAT